mgnify:FL=1
MHKYNSMRVWWSACLLYVTYFCGAHIPLSCVGFLRLLYVTHIPDVHTPHPDHGGSTTELYVTHIPDVHTPLLSPMRTNEKLYVTHIPDVHTPFPM